MKKLIKVLSLGAGVQSSALLLKYDQLFDFAVFADTGDEPKEVYTWLEKLKKKAKTEIIIAQRARISEDTKKYNSSTVPLFYKSSKTGKSGMGRRYCTGVYKQQVVDKAIKTKLGYKKHKQIRKHFVHLYLGITIDEEGRVSKSREFWKEHKYPFVEDKVNRETCKNMVYKIMGEFPPRSACVFCPYKPTKEYLELKENHPEDFEKACQFDDMIRDMRKGMKQYVNRNMIPLRDISKKEAKKEPQYSFEQMCDGGCGV